MIKNQNYEKTSPVISEHLEVVDSFFSEIVERFSPDLQDEMVLTIISKFLEDRERNVSRLEMELEQAKHRLNSIRQFLPPEPVAKSR